MSEKKKTAFDERMARRWEVSHRTILNWRKAAEEAGGSCPMDAEDPGEFLEWYLAVMGRNPSAKLKEAAARITREAGEGLEIPAAVEIDRAPVEVIGGALDMLSKSRTLERALAEEEIASKIYEEKRAAGATQAELSMLRKRWSDAVAMVREAKKGDDAVEVALELLKEMMRREMEPGERKRRKALDDAGVMARERLMETTSAVEWEREWKRVIEGALASVKEEGL